uniref:Uncharacterized protein n=1 Tax=Candidatus Kentrum sp. TC TaxID=2126339 RepID=A0A450ZC09_9GAMM|nr:MAG: hypothetical protein BECKTC1821F_GA0114240_100151 [Candidatus Kentron sp. TC]
MRWISTPDSVENNEPTALALLETLLAVAAYWGVAWWFDTHLHLLASISLAPWLLLRSKESTERGVRWFVAYWEDKTEITPKDTPWRFWGIVLSSALITGVSTYWLADTFLLGHTGWALFARSLGLGMLAWMIAFMVAVAVAVAVAEAVAGAGAVAGTWVLALPFLLAVGASVWLRSLGVRVLATLRHPWRGFQALPENWRRILLAVDSHHAPELAPGLSARIEEFSLPGIVEKIRVGDWGDRLMWISLIPIWFLPGLLYRWSLKSTCWLYLPLIYLGGGLRWRPRTAKEKGMLVSDLNEGRVEQFRRWLAVGVAASLVITTAIGHPALQSAMRESLSQFPLVLRSFLWVSDLLTEQAATLAHLWRFNGLDLAPWQWLNCLGAAITAALFFYSDRVERRWRLAREETPGAAPAKIHVARLLGLTRLRNLCAILYVPLAFGYGFLALDGFDPARLTGWLAPLGVLYGPYL